MLQGLYNSVSGALVQQARLSIVSNNIANMNTVGYKKDVGIFHHRLSEALENPELRHKSNLKLTPLGGGIYMTEDWTDHRKEGPIEQTDNPLHLTVRGEGYFQVTDAAGEKVAYTRNGNFHRTAEGFIATENESWFLTDNRGNRVFAPEGAEIRFVGNRDVYINGEAAGKAQVVNFADSDLRNLKKVGDNLYEAKEGIEPVDFEGNVLVGYLEGSTVSGAEEMVEMIQTQRRFEMNMRMITLQDQTIERAIRDVGSAPTG